MTGIYFKFQYKLSSTFFLLNAQAHTNKEQVKGRDLYVNSSQCSVNIQDDCHINVVGLLFRQSLSSWILVMPFELWNEKVKPISRSVVRSLNYKNLKTYEHWTRKSLFFLIDKWFIILSPSEITSEGTKISFMNKYWSLELFSWKVL